MTLRTLVTLHGAACISLITACASALPLPPRAQHAQASFGEVPYPPPAALAETVPRKPTLGGVVWVDGEWSYRGKFYVWQRGGWVVPPGNAAYAASDCEFLADGRIMLAPGTWYDQAGKTLPRPEFVVPASTPPNQVTPEFQTGR